MSASTPPREVPLPHDSVVWWWLSQIMRPFVGFSPERRVEGLSQHEATNRILDRAFGSEPTAEARRNGLQVLTTLTILAGAVLGLMGGALGVAALALTDDTSAHWIIRVSAMLFAGPALAIGSVWAFRWSLSLRKWNNGVPPRGSQPRDRDLFYAAPIALGLACFFALI